MGSKIYLDADVRLEYHPRNTLSGLWKQYAGYGRGRSRTVRRHPGSMRARQLAVPLHVALSGVALLLAAWLPWLMLWPAAYATVLLAVSVGLAARHRSLCGLLAGPSAFVMHTAWALGFFQGMLSLRESVWQPEKAIPLWDGAAVGASHD